MVQAPRPAAPLPRSAPHPCPVSAPPPFLASEQHCGGKMLQPCAMGPVIHYHPQPTPLPSHSISGSMGATAPQKHPPSTAIKPAVPTGKPSTLPHPTPPHSRTAGVLCPGAALSVPSSLLGFRGRYWGTKVGSTQPLSSVQQPPAGGVQKQGERGWQGAGPRGPSGPLLGNLIRGSIPHQGPV